ILESAIQLQDIEEAAHTLGLQIHVVNAGSEQEIDAAFASFVQKGIGALVSGLDPFFRHATRSNCCTRGPLCRADDLWPARIPRRRWTSELCAQLCRRLSASRYLRWAYSQKQEGC